MRQIPSLDDPVKAPQPLLRLVWCSAGCRAKGHGGLNLHRTVPDSPAVSFNLRLSEILPGSVGDFGDSVWEDFRETLNVRRHGEPVSARLLFSQQEETRCP